MDFIPTEDDFAAWPVSSVEQVVRDILPSEYQGEYAAMREQNHETTSPLERVIKYAIDLGCKSIIREEYVLDPDYIAEYVAYYAKTFENISRHCVRLHFFSDPPNGEKTPLDFIAHARGSYIGYTTLRPAALFPQLVGPTVLKPSDTAHFVLSKDSFDVWLAGIKLSVRGAPYLQQDSIVASCSQAALWMALRSVQRKVGAALHNPAMITQAATRYVITAPTREGLATLQIMEALRNVGHSPEIIDLKKDREAGGHTNRVRLAIYPYLESEVPVLVTLFRAKQVGHAIVIVGHNWSAKAAHTLPLKIEIPQTRGYVGGPYDPAVKTAPPPILALNAASWIDTFFAHNDNTGPYQPFEARKNEQDAYTWDDVHHVIPVLPLEVTMPARSAEEVAYGFLGRMLEAPQIATQASGKLVLRTYFQDSNAFKAWANESELGPNLKRLYRMIPLPKYVWITEINLARSYDKANEGKGERIGEILIDPTATSNNQHCCILAHINLVALAPDIAKVGILFLRSTAEHLIAPQTETDAEENGIYPVHGVYPIADETICKPLRRVDVGL